MAEMNPNSFASYPCWSPVFPGWTCVERKFYPYACPGRDRHKVIPQALAGLIVDIWELIA